MEQTSVQQSGRSSADVERTLRKLRKKTVYGKPRRAYGMVVDNSYEEWYIDNMDRFQVELPQALKMGAAAAASKVLLRMKKHYSKDNSASAVDLCDRRLFEIDKLVCGSARNRDKEA